MDWLDDLMQSIRNGDAEKNSGLLWETFYAKYVCIHEYESRFRIISNGTKIYGLQCLSCGRWEAKAKSYFGINTPATGYDDLIREKWFEKRKEASTAVFNAIQEYRSQKNSDEQIKRRSEYAEYLKSERWSQKRNAVLIRDRFLCQGCLSNKATEVHHLTYSHVGNELLFQLVSVCRKCHLAIHGVEEHQVDLSELIK